MKKIVVLFLAVMVVLGLSACSYEATYTIHEDGSVDIEAMALYGLDDMKEIVSMGAQFAEAFGTEIDPESQARMDAFNKIETVDEFLAYLRANSDSDAGFEGMEKKVINGITYLCYPEETIKNNLTAENMQETLGAGFVVLPDRFEFDNQGLLDMYESKYGAIDMEAEGAEAFQTMLDSTNFYFTIEMPEEIAFTNGKLLEDKKSVYFEINLGEKGKKYYAYTASSDGIIDLGIEDGAVTNKKSIKISTPDKVSSVTVNGNKVSGKKISLNEDGKYTVVVKTATKEKTVSFTKDSTKPVVTGVENGKTYKSGVAISFSDELSGIKSAKLGKKKVKSGVKVTKPGKYTLKVTDKAGNKTTVKFTVEK